MLSAATEVIIPSHPPAKDACKWFVERKAQQRKENASGCQELSRLLPGNNFLAVHLLCYPSENLFSTESSRPDTREVTV